MFAPDVKGIRKYCVIDKYWQMLILWLVNSIEFNVFSVQMKIGKLHLECGEQVARNV